MRHLSLFCLLAAVSLCSAADPAKPSQVRWPKPAAPAPQPEKPAAAVDKLSADLWYVIDSDVELLIFDSPVGKVEKVAETGPFKVRGKFADGSGAVETRTYKGKFVYFIEVKAGTTAGPVDLIVGPAGAAKESDFERRTLQVDGKPAPPPGPPPVPEPTDPLFPSIKAAYAKAKDPVALDKLIGVYKAAAATDLKPFLTAGQLRAALKDTVKQHSLGDDDLRPVREAIQVELEQFLPKLADAALTQDSRANATSAFKRIVVCLEALR